MSNYHNDLWINEQVHAHLLEAKTSINPNNIVCIAYQGSGNYGLDTPMSDVDTKLIITPTLKEIVDNTQPKSYTYVRANEEHIDIKDVRLICQTFRKQNLNFVEILFTPYFQFANEIYNAQWLRLVSNRDKICRLNPFRAVKSMKGLASEKFHALEHPYPSKLDIIAEHGFDGKQLSHLLRIEYFITAYINNRPYIECMRPLGSKREMILLTKRHELTLQEARDMARESNDRIIQIADQFCQFIPDQEDKEMIELLQDVQYEIMKASILNEVRNDV